METLKRKVIYEQVYDDVGIELDIASGHILKIACCDCGLVHNMAFAIEENGMLGISMERNVSATTKRRRTSEARRSISRIARESSMKLKRTV